MRLRNVTGSREKIAENSLVIQNPENQKGRWKELFGNDNPIHIEVGMGKGKFIETMAKENPGINYIGIEKYSSVLIRALDRYEEYDIHNLYFIRMDAETIADVFAPGEVKGIYLNFSDPWPKDRHARRRLTSGEFLARYDKFLTEEGRIFFKTDNRELFDFSLEQVKEAGWELESCTYDLHNSPYAVGNIMTEYEEKFAAEGKPINRMVIWRKKS